MSVSGLTLTRGLAPLPYGGGGIDNSGTLTLRNADVSGNASNWLFGGRGGGIRNAGVRTILGSTIRGNTAHGISGIGNAGGGSGGGIDNTGTLTVVDSTIRDNLAEGGGLKAIAGGVAAYPGRGGGVANSGTLTLVNVKFLGNTADGGLGTNRNGLGGLGGGLYNTGTAALTGVTFEHNSALGSSDFGPPRPPGHGGGVATSGRVTSSGSTYANPVGGNLFVSGGGAFVSLGRNVFSDVPPITLDPTDVVPSVPTPAPLTLVGLRRLGVHRQPTRFVLSFSAALDPAIALDLANYTLVPAGPRGHVGPHPRPIQLASAVYDPATRAVTLTSRNRVSFHGYVRLTASANGPNGLKSAAEAPLDGSGQGRPKSDYVALVHGGGVVTPRASRVGRPE